MDGQAVPEQIVLGRPAPELPVKLIALLPAEVWLPGRLVFEDGNCWSIELPISLNGFTAAVGAAMQ